MSYSFNLLERPWIPCQRKQGVTESLSIREVLAQAHELVAITHDSPLVGVSMLRVLLAILHRVYGPSDTDAWAVLTDDVKILDLCSAKDDDFQLAIHVPVRLWTEGDTLRIAVLESDWIVEQAGKQLAIAPADKRTLITAPGEAVRMFLTKVGADPKAYNEQGILRRLK